MDNQITYIEYHGDHTNVAIKIMLHSVENVKALLSCQVILIVSDMLVYILQCVGMAVCLYS